MATIIGNGTLTSLTVNGVPWLPQGGGATSQVAFESALRAALAGNRELNWLNGDVTLTAPIVIDISANSDAHGIRMHGARILCDFNDATKYAITYRIASGLSGIVFRGPNLTDITFQAVSPAMGAVQLECRNNVSWIFGFVHKGLTCSGFADASLFYHGSVFEFQIVDCVMTTSKHAYKFRNCGPVLNDPGYTDTNVGIISAVWIRGGTLRDHTDHPIVADASQPFREPYDFTVRDIYVVNNNGTVLLPNGFTLFDGVGFENNQGAGVSAAGHGTMIACRAAANGAHMPYLVSMFLAGPLTLFSCSVANEDPYTGMKIGTISGTGKVHAYTSGISTDYVLGGSVTFETSLP